MSYLNPLNIQKPQDIHLSDEERHTQFKNAGLDGNYSSMTGLIYNGNNVRTEVAGKANIKELYNEIDGQIHQLEGYNQDGVNDVLDEYDEEYQDTISNISDKGAYDPTVAYHFGNVVDYSTLNSKITPKYNNKQTTTTGKQLFDVNSTIINRSSTTTINGNIVNITAANSGSNGGALWNVPVTQGQEITISYSDITTITGNEGNNNVNYRFSDHPYVSGTDTWSFGTVVNKTDKTVTVTATEAYLLLMLRTSNGASYDISDLMVRPASVADDTWEPYTDGKSSPSPDYQQKIASIKPVNLFDKDNANIYRMFINQQSGKLDASSATRSIYMPIIGGNTYTVSRTSKITNRFSVATSDTLPTEDLPKMPLEYVVDNDSFSITLATSSTAQYLVVYLSSSQSDETLTEQLQNLQIEEGDTQHTYAPYGKIPLRCYTNNLANNCNYTLPADQTSSTSWGKSPSDYIKVEYGKTYTLSFYYNNVLNYSNTNGYAYVYAYDSNKERIGNTDFMLSSTVGSDKTTATIDDVNISYLKVMIGARGLKGDNFKAQLEEGSTRTDYKPYYNKYFYVDMQGNELSKITAGTSGSPKIVEDDITIDDDNNIIFNKKVGKCVLVGTETITYESSNSRFVTSISNSITAAARNNLLCDRFVYVASGNSVDGGCFIFNGKLYLYNFSYNTVEDFQEWLSTHNTTLYYELRSSQQISLGTLPADFLPHIGNVNIEVCTNLEATNRYTMHTDSYLTLQDTTAGTLPTNTTYFKNIGLTGDIGDSSMGTVTCGVWDSTTTYNEKDLVAYGTDLYVAKQANTNQAPSSESQYWELIIQYDKPLVALSNNAPENIIKGSLWLDII